MHALKSFRGKAVDLVEVLQCLREQVFGFGDGVLFLGSGIAVCGPPGQEPDVGEADAVAGTEQDTTQGDAREGIGHRARVGQDLDDLGQVQKPRQVYELGGNVAFIERPLQRGEQPAAAAQDRVVGPAAPFRVQFFDGRGDVLRLGPLIGEPAYVDFAIAPCR